MFCSQLSAHIPKKEIFEAFGEIPVLQRKTLLCIFSTFNLVTNHTFVGRHDLGKNIAIHEKQLVSKRLTLFHFCWRQPGCLANSN
jgi:hypothetical protein